MDEMKQLFDGIVEGNAKLVRSLTESALAAGMDPIWIQSRRQPGVQPPRNIR